MVSQEEVVQADCQVFGRYCFCILVHALHPGLDSPIRVSFSSIFSRGQADKQGRAGHATPLTKVPDNHPSRSLPPRMCHLVLLWRSSWDLLFQLLKILGISSWWIHIWLVLARYSRRRIDHLCPRSMGFTGEFVGRGFLGGFGTCST